MRILITGASGMLGHSMLKTFEGHKLFATSRHKPQYPCDFFPMDLAKPDFAALMQWAQPDLVIHAGALTDVDLCNRESELAHKINVEAVEQLLLAMPSRARLFYVSSEAVYAPKPYPYAYKEHDALEAMGVYARTKLQAEELIRNSKLSIAILRATIVGYPSFSGKESFTQWLIHSLSQRKKVELFEDAYFNPISADQLSRFISENAQGDLPQVLNLGISDCLSKRDFGLRLAQALEFETDLIGTKSLLTGGGIRKNNQCVDVSQAKRFGLQMKAEDVIGNLRENYQKWKMQEA